MTLTATRLPPSDGFGVYRCPEVIPHGCEGMGTASSDAAGALTLESTAVQRVAERAHCGVDCVVIVTLGGTVDCTRPDACGVAFFRLESNGLSTLWAAPIEIAA